MRCWDKLVRKEPGQARSHAGRSGLWARPSTHAHRPGNIVGLTLCSLGLFPRGPGGCRRLGDSGIALPSPG